MPTERRSLFVRWIIDRVNIFVICVKCTFAQNIFHIYIFGLVSKFIDVIPMIVSYCIASSKWFT